MSQEVAPQGVRASGTFGQQVGGGFLGMLGGAVIAWLAMGVFPSVALGGGAALLAAAVVYRSRRLRAAAAGMVVGGGIVVVLFAYLFFFAYDGLSAM